ncbi:MAG: hypothetical protein PF568_05520 [Deltaproteobacteria bacterium]|jgi:hypothetical protein|nr:hypothetical protein [Deltaproteobacteria bacterium]
MLWCRRSIILIASFLLLAGCAGLPTFYGISGVEEREVRRRFQDMVASQAQCQCCLDGAAHVTVKNLFSSGFISGYLQAMSPSYLKFVGVNPLGQPLLIFTTNGRRFQYVAIEEGTVYQGEVDSATFRKYTPDGFNPGLSYYWLTGRLQPGPVELTGVSRDEQGGYWVDLLMASGSRALVLFEPETLQIRRHIVLNSDGKRVLNILYDQYGPEECAVPRHIKVTSLAMDSVLEIRLDDLLEDVSFSRGDLELSPPAALKEVLVE